MRLRFIGLNGSMGLHFGQIYRLTIHPWQNGVRITSPVVCPYDSDKSFWQNWAHPNEELRTVMEAKGRDLRKIHIPHENGETHEVLEHLAPGVSHGAQGEDRADQGLGVHGVGTPVAEARRILGRDGANR